MAVLAPKTVPPGERPPPPPGPPPKPVTLRGQPIRATWRPLTPAERQRLLREAERAIKEGLGKAPVVVEFRRRREELKAEVGRRRRVPPPLLLPLLHRLLPRGLPEPLLTIEALRSAIVGDIPILMPGPLARVVPPVAGAARPQLKLKVAERPRVRPFIVRQPRPPTAERIRVPSGPGTRPPARLIPKKATPEMQEAYEALLSKMARQAVKRARKPVVIVRSEIFASPPGAWPVVVKRQGLRKLGITRAQARERGWVIEGEEDLWAWSPERAELFEEEWEGWLAKVRRPVRPKAKPKVPRPKTMAKPTPAPTPARPVARIRARPAVRRRTAARAVAAVRAKVRVAEKKVPKVEEKAPPPPPPPKQVARVRKRAPAKVKVRAPAAPKRVKAVRLPAALPAPVPGMVAWRQGKVWLSVLPPYKRENIIYSRRPPAGARVLTGPPARTLFSVGKPPARVTVPLGVVKATVLRGRRILFRAVSH